MLAGELKKQQQTNKIKRFSFAFRKTKTKKVKSNYSVLLKREKSRERSRESRSLLVWVLFLTDSMAEKVVRFLNQSQRY